MARKGKVVDIGELTVDELVIRAEDGEPVILTRDGQPVAAVLEIGSLRALTDERELLRRLALGELESAAGEGDELTAVLEDCRLLMEEN